MIKKGQIYRKKKGGQQLLIFRKVKSSHWQAKVLTDRPGVYNGTHKMLSQVLIKDWELIA
jgi:hypothetical protein